MIAIDLSKQEALDVDSKAIQQINFTGNMANSNGEKNFSHKLLLTIMQNSKLCKVFANGSSVNIELLKDCIRLQKIGQSEGVLGRLLESLLKSHYLAWL